MIKLGLKSRSFYMQFATLPFPQNSLVSNKVMLDHRLPFSRMLGFELWLHHLQDIILVASVPSFSICKLRILIASAYWCVYQQSGFIKRAESIEVVSSKGFVIWIQPVKLWEMLGNWRMERRVQISKQELPVSQSEKPFIPALEVGLGLGVCRVYGNLLSLDSICLRASTTRLWMKPRTAVGQQIQELERQPLSRVEAVGTF